MDKRVYYLVTLVESVFSVFGVRALYEQPRYAVMQIPGGLLADRFGAKRVLLTALLIWSLFTGLDGSRPPRSSC